MALRMGNWLHETSRVYFGNATATRDFRVQLRGNRSVILFSVYLVVLIGVAMLVYTTSVEEQGLSVIRAQANLKNFYNTVIYLLAGMISLVTPSLAATAVVIERQRRSLDLVFSGPVSAKYYLVGKMISSYRFIWMLLVLSLPVTATCVMLGGASWQDVLGVYFLLSMHGLMFAALGLLLSAGATRPIQAITYSYAGVVVYLVFTAMCAGVLAFGSGMARATSGEMPFMVATNPFFVMFGASTHTTIAGWAVPNYVLGAAFAFAFCKLMLLAAASTISPYGSAETRGIRIHGLVYVFAIYCYAAFSIAPLMTGVSGAWTPDGVMGTVFGYSLIWLMVVLPFVSCFGNDGERKYWPNGVFSVKRIFDGTPAGGFPYLLALLASCTGAVVLGAYWSGHPLGPDFARYAYLAFGLWTLFWSFGRVGSAANMGLRGARTLQLAAVIFLAILPVPFLNSLFRDQFDLAPPTVWDFYVLRPLTNGNAQMAVVHGTVMLVAGLIIAGFAERKARRTIPHRDLEA